MPDELTIRRYLLGLLPEADAEAVEDAYFASPETFDLVRAVEEDLLDDHAAGRLAPDEKDAFEARYLASEPLRRRVTTARALRMAGAPAAARRAGIPRWLAPLAIAAGVVLAIGSSWFWRSRAPELARSVPPPRVGGLETPPPVASASPSPAVSPEPGGRSAPSPAGRASTRLVLALSPTLLRGEGESAQLRIPPRTDTVVLELQGDATAVPAGSRLVVLIETVDGERAWSGPARRNGRPSLAAVAEIPAARLAQGDYLVTLTGGGDTIHRYFLRILVP